MSKNKFVVFNSSGIARVVVAPSVADFNVSKDDVVFENPDLSACIGVSPEFWTHADGKITPITDKKLIEKRYTELHIQPLLKKIDDQIVDKAAVLERIPEVLDNCKHEILSAIDKNLKALTESSQTVYHAVYDARVDVLDITRKNTNDSESSILLKVEDSTNRVIDELKSIELSTSEESKLYSNRSVRLAVEIINDVHEVKDQIKLLQLHIDGLYKKATIGFIVILIALLLLGVLK
jgi:hypothetical protein